MATVTIKRSIPVLATPTQVFAAITDWPQQHRWMLGTSVTAGKHQGRALSGTIIALTRLGPFGFRDPMTITEWEPPYRCGVMHTGRIVRGTGLFEVQPMPNKPEQSNFVWSEVTTLPFGVVGRLGWVLAAPFVNMAIDYSLRRFKRWVEKN